MAMTLFDVFFAGTYEKEEGGVSGEKEELGPRTANMALLICLKMKIIEKVLKRDYSTNESLLIICLWL